MTYHGVFSTLNKYSTDELFFPYYDFGGTLWENRENYEKWDPARHLNNWATPHLIIHSELDYRLPISVGLESFNILQTRGVPSKFVTFSDENHVSINGGLSFSKYVPALTRLQWVLKPENALVWYNEVLGWINKYSGIQCSK